MGLRKLKLQVYLTEFWSHFKYTKKARLITFWGCEDAERYGIFNVSQHRYISHYKSNLYFCQVWRSFCLLSHSHSQCTGFYDCVAAHCSSYTVYVTWSSSKSIPSKIGLAWHYSCCHWPFVLSVKTRMYDFCWLYVDRVSYFYWGKVISR